MKNGQKIKLGDAHVTPRNIQEVHVSRAGARVRLEAAVSAELAEVILAAWWHRAL
jgi:hypothetical protein